MRKLTFLILSGLIPFCGTLQADDDAIIDNRNTSAETNQAADNEDQGIFNVSVKADWIQKAKIDKRGFPHNHLKFGQANIEGTAVVYYNPQYKEGLALGVGYDQVYFNWNDNFYFNQKKFNQVTFALSAFSARVCDWLWQAQIAVNCDAKRWNFSEYTNYDFFLWGRYEFCYNINFHAGFYAQTGMKIDHIYPVLGFDWKINDQWKLNAVYPFNMSLVYSYSENWSAALAIRLFNVRYRTGKHEHLEKGLFQYRNSGLELAINYDDKKYSGNVHAGCTGGGEFVISNKNNKHKHHFNLDAAPYIGGEIAMKF
ncbi:MAG: hypothetical protein H0U49_08920 [Parachlamydiaceae bacterium]|nr:hypothetical protein [Parachlamydiaceae bacterium]